MNYGFRFSKGRLCTNVVISGNAQDIVPFDLNDVLIDTGASNSGFPKEKLKAAGAIKGLGEVKVTTANGTGIVETYQVMVALGTYGDISLLNQYQLEHKKNVESTPIDAYAPETDIAIIGRDILKRYKKIYVNWHDQQVIDIDLA